MATASAEPEQLRLLAAAIARAGRRLDDATLAIPPGRAALQARGAADRLTELARDLRRVASAFEAADGGRLRPSAIRTDDGRLVAALARRYPGMATGALTPLGVSDVLRATGPAAAAHLLADEALVDPVGAAEVVAELGGTRRGRVALREFAGHLPRRLPTSVVVALAQATLLGATERDDVLAARPTATSAGELRAADRGAGSIPILRLLAADADATRAFEAAVPRGRRSPVLELHRRVPARAALTPIAKILAHVTLGANPVPRVVSGIAGAAIDADGMHRVPAAYSRFLAAVVARHPSVVDQLTLRAKADRRSQGGVFAGRLSTGQRFYEALARDERALRTALTTLVARRARLVAGVLRTSPPGTVTAWELQGALDHGRRSIVDLAVGADASGRYDRRELMLAIAGTRAGLGAGLKGAARFGPYAAAAQKPARSVVDRGATWADASFAHHDDHREDPVLAALVEGDAALAATAMAADPRWRAAMRSTPPRRGDPRALRRWLARQPVGIRRVLRPLLVTRPDPYGA